ncbi:MAG: phage tail sheath family protein [Thermomicrobiales bacterium]
MPVNPTYPGVYIEELRSAVRTIIGVPTAIAAFVGPALRGPVDEPRHITSWADFQRVYGGLAVDSPMSYAVYHYYQNGGSEAEIVRIANNAKPAKIELGGGVELTARYSGKWGNSLRARVDYKTKDPNDNTLYNLAVRDTATGAEERYLNISIDAASPRALAKVLQTSALVKSTGKNDTRPEANADPQPGQDPFADPPKAAAGGAPAGGGGAPVAGGGAAPAAGAGAAKGTFTGSDNAGGPGDTVTAAQYKGDEAKKTGIYALLNTDIFNLLCLPGTEDADVLAAAVKLCTDRRAVFLVDAPSAWTDLNTAANANLPITGEYAKNAAIYFPRMTLPDPLQEGRPGDFPPSGAIAGIIARTDAQRGVWKAPAGIDASVNGVQDLNVPLTDLENGELNPRGINCLRNFRVFGTVVWGARTMRGADELADQWKYLPVRRLALYIEESLYRGTQWVVFEPNDEPLWSAIRLNVGAFMNTLFRQGAFQGRTPRDAYLVKCDSQNNPQNDIDRGIVNILVGFAPLKPAEFVFIQIQQLAGQIQV